MTLKEILKMRKQGKCPYTVGKVCIHCEYVMCPGKEGR